MNVCVYMYLSIYVKLYMYIYLLYITIFINKTDIYEIVFIFPFFYCKFWFLFFYPLT